MGLGQHKEEPADSPPPAPPVWERLGKACSPAERRPRLVAGVEQVTLQSRTGATCVMIHNPAAGTYLKLDVEEADLLPLMDGSRSVKALAVVFYQRHGVLALSRIAGLVEFLRRQRFLSEEPLGAYERLEQQLRTQDTAGLGLKIVRGVLHARWELPHVGKLVGWLYERGGRLLFTRPLLVLGTLLGLLSPALFVWETQRGRYHLLAFATSSVTITAALFVANYVATAGHELGHALAVRHASRSVRQAGMLIYYGHPVPFVDTTDIWMAPLRSRLLASYAGPLVDFLLGGAAVVAAVVLPQSTLGAFLFTWGTLFVATSFLNFNPLLELDGYYLLIDWLDKPLLRARAFAFVRGPLWKKVWQRERLTSEEWFFAGFGLAAAVVTLLLLVSGLLFWEHQIGPTVGKIWEHGDLWARAALVLLGLLFGTPIVLAIWSGLRAIPGAVRPHLAWLGRQAARATRAQAMEAVRAVPVWSSLPEAALIEIAGALRARAVAAGNVVVRQGDPGDRFYVIDSGAFEVVVNGVTVGRLGRGDYFGERALLSGARRAATVLAVAPGRVFYMEQAAFHALLAGELAFRSRVEERIAHREALAGMKLFQGLGARELDALLARMNVVQAAADEAVVTQGTPGHRFYVVSSGRFAVERDGEAIAELGVGQAFGEISLLLDVPRTATVRALEPSELLALDADDFHDLLAGYCGRANELRQLSSLRLAAHRPLGQGSR